MGYKGRYFTRLRVWRLGSHVEVELYPVFQKPGVRRKKCRPSREAQRLLNQKNREAYARRLILLNFSQPGSLEVDLTFDRPAEKAEAVDAMGKYLRKLRGEYRKAGSELRYMYAKEQGARSGKWHFHLLLPPGLSRERVEVLWQNGYANTRRLRIDETGLAGLAEYITKQGRKRRPEHAGERRWSCSKNLQRPEPEVRDGEISVREIEKMAEAIQRRSAEELTRELAPGMTLVEAEAVQNLRNRGMYIHLRLAAPECWHGRRPIARYTSGQIGGEAA